jgi:hypothetical protein
VAALEAICRSRLEPASGARILLAYRKEPSFFAAGRAIGVHHQTAQRCVERALAYGPMAALDYLPRPGREPNDHRGGQGLDRRPGMRPKNSVIRTNCGQRPFSPALRVSMGRRRGIPPCLAGAAHKILNAQEIKPYTRSVITGNVAIRSSRDTQLGGARPTYPLFERTAAATPGRAPAISMSWCTAATAPLPSPPNVRASPLRRRHGRPSGML